ncbi:hypothetical protein [Atribacter laminatus]|uniref:Protein-arginine kinase n=1 Tax=Atribacter laminatus TaxID=2847778 RepID=A0A7T1AJE3_ATRLM|nr:hypothetical protein [Atribacter laminatus]QPM67023.1 Protein-arginine kinase [Atribacter laminatus]
MTIFFPKFFSQKPGELSKVISRISLSRNIEGIPFPNRATSIWIEDLKQRIRNLYQKFFAPKKYQWVQLDTVPNNVLQRFYYQNLIPREVLEDPSNRYLIYSNYKGILINYLDHLQIFSVTTGLDLNRIYQDVNKLDNIIEKNIDYAFSEEWGFLTSHVNKVGTGMDLSVTIHLPALSLLYGENRFIQWMTDKNLLVKNFRGEDGVIGHIYHFSNIHSLGVSEWQIISDLKKFGCTLSKWEKQVREALKNNPPRSRELEETVMIKGRQLYRSSHFSLKDIFDFLSVWALAWQCGIFSPRKGLKLLEVRQILQKIWGNDTSLKQECLNILRFFRVISGEELYDV